MTIPTPIPLAAGPLCIGGALTAGLPSAAMTAAPGVKDAAAFHAAPAEMAMSPAIAGADGERQDGDRFEHTPQALPLQPDSGAVRNALLAPQSSPSAAGIDWDSVHPEMRAIRERIMAELGGEYGELAAEAGIASRIDDFLEFAKTALKGRRMNETELREAYAEKLGWMDNYYRGLKLTPEEAAKYLREGLPSNFLRLGFGDIEDAKRLVLEKGISHLVLSHYNFKLRGTPFLSISPYEGVAIFTPYTFSSRRSKVDTYVFKLKVRAIDAVPVHTKSIGDAEVLVFGFIPPENLALHLVDDTTSLHNSGKISDDAYRAQITEKMRRGHALLGNPSKEPGLDLDNLAPKSAEAHTGASMNLLDVALLVQSLGSAMPEALVRNFVAEIAPGAEQMVDLIMSTKMEAGTGPASPADTTITLPPRPVSTSSTHIDLSNPTVPDRVEIIGKHVDFLHKLSQTGDKTLVKHWGKYIDYAETADPLTAAVVYSRLISVEHADAQKNASGHANPVDEDPEKRLSIKKIWSLAVSLHGAGYREEASRIFGQIPAMAAKEKYAHHLVFDLGPAARAGAWDAIRAHAKMVGDFKYSSETEKNRDSTTVELATSMVKAIDGVDAAQIPPWYMGEVWAIPSSRNFISDLFKECLSSEFFFRDALERLRDHYKDKNPRHASSRMEHAARNLPPNFSDEEREKFARYYIELAPRAVEEFKEENKKYRYAALLKVDLDNRPDDSYHIHWRQMTRIANVYLGASDLRLRARGLELLNSLSESEISYNDDYYESDKRVDLMSSDEKKFCPALWKASALIEAAPMALPEERRSLLAHALDLIGKSRMVGVGNIFKAYVTSDLARQAAKLGFYDIAERTIEAWDTEVEKELQSATLRTDREKNRETCVNEVRFVLSMLRAVDAKGEGLRNWLGDVSTAEEQARPFFLRRHLLDAAKYFGTTEMEGQIGAEAARGTVDSIMRTAIRNFVRTTASSKYTFGEEFGKIVKTIEDKDLSIDDTLRDDLLEYLIEMATPRKGLYRQGLSIDTGLIWEAAKALKFVLGNPKTPKAEAALISRIRDAVDGVAYNRVDYRFGPALEGLSWVFRRLEPAGILDPMNAGRLRNHRATSDYLKAMDGMHPFAAGMRAKMDAGEARNRFAEALGRKDVAAISELSGGVRTAITGELAKGQLAAKRDEVDPGNSCQKISGKTLLAAVWGGWHRSLADGNDSLRQALFEMWAPSSTAEEADIKRILYYKALASSRVDRLSKRAIFGELCKTTDVSGYAKAMWKEIVGKGDGKMEDLFYAVAAPTLEPHWRLKNKLTVSAPKDITLALIFEDLPIEFDRGAFLRTALEQKAGKSDKLSAYDPIAWLHMASASSWPREKLRDVFTLLAARSLGEKSFWRRQSIDDCQEYLKCWPKVVRRAKTMLAHYQHDLFAGTSFTEDPLSYLSDNLTFPSARAGREEESLPLMDGIFEVLDTAMERILDRSFEMPDSFKKLTGSRGGRLADVLVTRPFVRLNAGSQQKLLTAIEHAPEGEALRIFFEHVGLEKIGQFLSYWPDMPENLRRELKQLQDRVAPTNYDRIRLFIMEQLNISADHELIRNLDINHEAGTALLGSGTIGECYRSKLTIDGVLQDVVIKVIHPSKEEKARDAMEHARAVQYILGLHENESPSSPYYVPHSRHAGKLIAMFLGMMENEFDLGVEAKNARRMSQTAEGIIGIPEHIGQYVTPKVSVQTHVKGIRIDEIGDLKIREQVARELKRFMFEHALQDGFYHSDLQPGNVLVDIDTDTGRIRKIWVLDFGQVGELARDEIENVMKLTANSIGRNSRDAQAILEAMQTAPDERKIAIPPHAIAGLLGDWDGDPGALPAVISRMFEASHTLGADINPRYLQVLKGFATFDATAKDAMAAAK